VDSEQLAYTVRRATRTTSRYLLTLAVNCQMSIQKKQRTVTRTLSLTTVLTAFTEN
jgi:hypothetical protein